MAEATNHDPYGLDQLVTIYRQLSALSAAVFAPLARTYVGTQVDKLEAKREQPLSSAQVVNLALRKLAFEAGETVVARSPPTDKPVPEFDVDEHGRAPDLKLAYVAAAALEYLKARDQKQAMLAQQQAAPAPQVEVLGNATTVRALRSALRAGSYAMAAPAPAQPAMTVRATGGGCGCGGGKAAPVAAGTSITGCGCGGGCGGTTTTPPPAPPPCYDPCAGGLVSVPPASESCGCGGAGGCSCQAQPATECPEFWSMSCETKLGLKNCLVELICDLILMIEKQLCANPATPFAAVLCKFIECVRLVLCPPPKQPCLPPAPPMPCLPCSYAVEMP